jgi:hypothetical protein
VAQSKVPAVPRDRHRRVAAERPLLSGVAGWHPSRRPAAIRYRDQDWLPSLRGARPRATLGCRRSGSLALRWRATEGATGRAALERPELVAEVEIAEWPASGKLRQASFKRLREDKMLPRSREVPSAASRAASDAHRRFSPTEVNSPHLGGAKPPVFQQKVASNHLTQEIDVTDLQLTHRLATELAIQLEHYEDNAAAWQEEAVGALAQAALELARHGQPLSQPIALVLARARATVQIEQEPPCNDNAMPSPAS